MSLTAQLLPEISLIGNPVRVDAVDIPFGSMLCRVRYNNTVIFESSAVADSSGRCTFDLNDILAPRLKGVAPVDNDAFIVEVKNYSIAYSVEIVSGSSTITLSGTCYGGGISQRLNKHLVNSGTNIFESKFLNHRANFFLTTRTSSMILPIRESELDYLYFINQGKRMEISDTNGNRFEAVVLPDDRKLYALNLNAVRYEFFKKSTLASVMNILINNKPSVTLAITPGHEQSILLSFKNSFGVFENIELAGKITVQPVFSDIETYGVWDNTYRTFSNATDRKEYQPAIVVNSGYNTTDELYFILDLLVSDTVYLVNGKEKINVLVSSSKYSYIAPHFEPAGIELKITAAENEQYFTPFADHLMGVLATNEKRPITTEVREIIVDKLI